MARYRGPVEKIERRFGVSLNLKGERRLAGKSALDKRPYGPGQHGQRRKKISEYGGRWLRVVVNENKVPPKLVTTFFDRKLRGQHNENKS